MEVGEKCESFHRGLLRGCNPVCFFFMVLYFVYPDNPGHISSLVPNPSFQTVLLLSIPTAYVVRTWWTNFHMLSITVSTGVFATVSGTKRIV